MLITSGRVNFYNFFLAAKISTSLQWCGPFSQDKVVIKYNCYSQFFIMD